MRLLPSSPIFRERDFLRLWGAQAVSAIGARITRTALPVLAVLSVDASALRLGILAAIAIGPSVVVSLAVGGVVDRSRKRPLLVTCDLVRAVAVLSLPLAAWTGVLTMAQLYVVAAVVGIGTAVFQIADNAYLPALLTGSSWSPATPPSRRPRRWPRLPGPAWPARSSRR